MDKIRSRKLWVWIVWAVLSILVVVVTKSIPADLISWFGVISLAYIGGNVLTKFIGQNKE